MAELHPQLQADCLLIGRFPLCRLLLMRDANYPWFILVPDREDVSEIYQLSADDQVQLTRESSSATDWLRHQAFTLTGESNASIAPSAACGVC